MCWGVTINIDLGYFFSPSMQVGRNCCAQICVFILRASERNFFDVHGLYELVWDVLLAWPRGAGSSRLVSARPRLKDSSIT